jgi:hypothetical protein
MPEDKRVEATCGFCFRAIMVHRSDPKPPKPDNDAGWDELLDQPTGFGHREDCDWVINKAFQGKPAYRTGFRD